MKCATELPVSTWIKLIKCYIGKATEGFSKSLKIWNPTPYCIYRIHTHMAKIKNTDIVMINTKFGILLTSEEEGGWDREYKGSFQWYLLSFYFFAACDRMGMCFISLSYVKNISEHTYKNR